MLPWLARMKTSPLGTFPLFVLLAFALLGLEACQRQQEEVPIEPSAPSPFTSTPPLTALPSSVPLAREAWEFTQLSDEQKADFERLLEEFRRDPARRHEIVERISDTFRGVDQVAFAREVLALGDAELSLTVVEMLSGNTSSSILPALHDALKSPDEHVRLAAAAAAAHVTHPDAVDFFAQVFNDSSENVRITGLHAIDEQRPVQRLNILDHALRSPHGDVQIGAIVDLQVESSQKSLEVMFQALDSPISDVREEAQFVIDFMIDQEFPSAAAARAWWKENRAKFDNDLVPLE